MTFGESNDPHARCYATVGVIGFVVVKLLFSIVGLALSLLWALLWLAAIGFLLYLVLKLINPKAARRMREKVSGREEEESDS